MRRNWLRILLLLFICVSSTGTHAQARVVQLVAENPSTFVSADPDDPKHIVSIFPDGAKAAAVLPEIPLLRSTIMTDAHGQQYNCSIPSSPSTWSTAVTQQKATSPAAASKTPFELIELLDGLCFYRQDGLWTYEVCHRKHVRQFRQDGSSKGEDFSCGKYNGDEQQVEAILEDTSSSGHPLKYISHTFSGGGKCVLTGAPRTAEVRYTCLRETKENVVISVREFPTCNYVVVLSTPFLCKHAAFVPPAEDLRLIACESLEVDSTLQDEAPGVTVTKEAAAATRSKLDTPSSDRDAAKSKAGHPVMVDSVEDDLWLGDVEDDYQDAYSYSDDDVLYNRNVRHKSQGIRQGNVDAGQHNDL